MGKSFDKVLHKIREITYSDAVDSNIKRDNANIDGNTAMGTMLQYGSAVSNAFCNDEIMSEEFSDAHENGDIHVHDKDFYATGTLTCCQIPIDKLFKGGFSTGHGYLREPQDIKVYGALTAIAIQANQNDQHGGQAIPMFDYYEAPGVLKTYKKHIKDIFTDITISDYEDYEEEYEKILHSLDKAIESINHISENECSLNRDDVFALGKIYSDIYASDTVLATKLAHTTLKRAWYKTNKDTYQSMEGIVHNLNTMHSRAGAQVPFSSLNFGTDTSPEGRMVTRNFLYAVKAGLGNGETPIFPISIFKVKEGVNFSEGDPNYDLFKLAMKVSAKRLFPNFSFVDAPFNLQYYNPEDPNTEITYMGCRTRTIGNINGDEVVTGRGNTSFTTLNLPRLGLLYGSILNENGCDFDGFFSALGSMMDLIVNQLLERFRFQSTKKVKNFPFLMGQGVWTGSENLDPEDSVADIIRQGTLSIGFIGLAECLIALIGHHHGESQEAQELGLKIVKFMNDKCEEASKIHKLNFSLLATPAEGLAGRFTKLDLERFGVVPGVTDKEFYTNSFHVPVYHKISAFKKIDIEAPYHALTPAGHITYIELDGDASANPEAFEAIIRYMRKAGIGYGAINHPIDRCPVCGYNGIIGDVCPNCGATESLGQVIFERIRRITGYLVGVLTRWNNAKRAEEAARVKHNI